MSHQWNGAAIEKWARFGWRWPDEDPSGNHYFGGCSDMGFFSLAIVTDVT